MCVLCITCTHLSVCEFVTFIVVEMDITATSTFIHTHEHIHKHKFTHPHAHREDVHTCADNEWRLPQRRIRGKKDTNELRTQTCPRANERIEEKNSKWSGVMGGFYNSICLNAQRYFVWVCVGGCVPFVHTIVYYVVIMCVAQQSERWRANLRRVCV